MKKPKSKTKLDEREWNFFDLGENERVACCFWEYARESNAIRDTVKIFKTFLADQGKPAPRTAEHEAFLDTYDHASGLLHQIGLPPLFWTALPFPETPWQRIDENERKKWAHVRPEISVPVKFPPFQVTGDLFIASWLQGEAEKANNARLAGEPPLAVEMRGMGGVDSFIAQINWGEFSKGEIKACFNKWVDDYDSPLAKPGDRGRGKRTEWQARLDRLGLLRLRCRHTIEETLQLIAGTLPKEKRESEKMSNPGECNRDAGRAVEEFRALFPFLAPDVMPRSWPMLPPP